MEYHRTFLAIRPATATNAILLDTCIGNLVVISIDIRIVTDAWCVDQVRRRNRKSVGCYGHQARPHRVDITLFLRGGDREENLLDGIGA